MTKQEFIEKISSNSMSRLMTRDEKYIIQKCREFCPELDAVTADDMGTIIQRIEATPEGRALAKLAPDELIGPETILVNLCNVCEDYICGRIPLPANLGDAIVEDFVSNTRHFLQNMTFSA